MLTSAFKDLMQSFADRHSARLPEVVEGRSADDVPDSFIQREIPAISEYEQANLVAGRLCYPIQLSYPTSGSRGSTFLLASMHEIREHAGEYFIKASCTVSSKPQVYRSGKMTEFYAGPNGTAWLHNMRGLAEQMRRIDDLLTDEMCIILHALLYIARCDNHLHGDEKALIAQYIRHPGQSSEDEKLLSDYFEGSFITPAAYKLAVSELDHLPDELVLQVANQCEKLIAADGRITEEERLLHDQVRLLAHN